MHIPGVCNALADAVSHDNLPFLFSQIPEAVSCRTLIPPALCALLIDQPDWTSPRWTQLFGSCFPPVYLRQPDAAMSLGLIVTFLSVLCLVYPLPSLHVNAFYLTLCPSYFKRGLLQIQLRAIWQPFAMHKYPFRWEILGLETSRS